MHRAKFLSSVFLLTAVGLILLLHTKPAQNQFDRRFTPAGNSSADSRSIPPAAIPIISAALGRDDARYQVVAADSRLRATNPRQDLTATFTSRAVTLTSGGSQMQVGLSAYGYKGSMRRVSPAVPESKGNRVEYRRGPLTEWFVNGPSGLEQGFTLTAPPIASNSGELEIALSLSGDMAPTIEANGKSVAFTSRDGKPVLCYTSLLALDSAGKNLPAHMDLRGDRLILSINDSGARYPVVVDPTYIQRGVITANTGSFLGEGAFDPGGVAIDDANQTIVAAAQGNGPVTASAYVFVGSSGLNSQWTQATQLLNVDQSTASVAISGDAGTIVVGSCGLNNCVGHAYVYQKPAASTGWSTSVAMIPTAALSSPNAQQSDRVGFSVATDSTGDTVAFGVPCDFTAGITLCGSVDVYAIPASGTWVDSNQPTAVLTFNLPGGAQVDGLGVSVAMDSTGDTIAAGAIGTRGASNEDGILSVFVRPAGTPNSWATTSSPSATLVESPGFPADEFGFSASIDSNGDTIVVGAPFSPDNCSPEPCFTPGPGTAYVFLRPKSAGGWKDAPNPKSQDATLTPSDGNSGDAFGSSVSVDAAGDTVVVGAPRNPLMNKVPGPGAAYVFTMPSGGWSNAALHEDEKLTAVPQQDFNGVQVTPGPRDFAGSVFISSDGRLITVGNSQATVGNTLNQGAVFLFVPGSCAVLLPTTGDFGSIPQFTTSPSLQFQLSNSCPTDLKNINPAISGTNASDFTLMNTCATSLAGFSACNLNVTMTPSIVGAESATLSVSDLDILSPQTAALTGTGSAGNADFTLAPTSANPASTGSNCTPPSDTTGSCSATVVSGNKASYTLQLTSLNGFAVPVDVTLSPLPPNASCGNFLVCKQTVTPTPTGASVTFNIATNGSSGAVTQAGAAGAIASGAPTSFGGALPALLVAGVLFGRRLRNRRAWLRLIGVGVIAITAGGWMGDCHRSSMSPPPPQTTPSGTYLLTVTGTGPGPGGSPTHSAQVTLIVQ